MLVTEPMERSRLVAVVREAVSGGVNAVQLRDKSSSDLDLLDTALAVKACLGDCPLLVNRRPSVAVRTDIAGVHLPEQGPGIEAARAIVGAGRLIGRSVHSSVEAEAAERAGADYLVAGTVFASRSHPGLPPVGIGFVRSVCMAVSLPVIAIGGVTPENAVQCLASGASGVAVLSAILYAANPRAAATRYWERLAAFTGE